MKKITIAALISAVILSGCGSRAEVRTERVYEGANVPALYQDSFFYDTDNDFVYFKMKVLSDDQKEYRLCSQEEFETAKADACNSTETYYKIPKAGTDDMKRSFAFFSRVLEYAIENFDEQSNIVDIKWRVKEPLLYVDTEVYDGAEICSYEKKLACG